MPGTSAQNPPDRLAKKLSIDRLYSLPWLIGTKPQDPRWSAESRQLAFLWNDEGTNFYDVWMTDVTTPKPIRVTSMPRLDSPPDPGTDLAKLEQVARAETDRGVSAVIWAPDGKHLIFTFHGLLYWVLPGHSPERLIDSSESQRHVAAAPRGNRVAYVSGRCQRHGDARVERQGAECGGEERAVADWGSGGPGAVDQDADQRCGEL